jgi:hypothetical protein
VSLEAQVRVYPRITQIERGDFGLELGEEVAGLSTGRKSRIGIAPIW